MSLILASGSPRRRELLAMIGIGDFIVLPPEGGEQIPHGLPPAQTVCEIAYQKAKNVSKKCDICDTIIAADTLVYLDGRPLGKPCGPDDAASMLRELSGRRHTVYTGVAVIKDGMHMTEAETTDVFFRYISDTEIAEYINTGEPVDKAGAYGAQGRGAVFIERIEGDFFNVMGLPLCRLYKMLTRSADRKGIGNRE